MLKLWPGQQGLPWGRYLPTLLPAGMKVLPCNTANTPVASCARMHIWFIWYLVVTGVAHTCPPTPALYVFSHMHTSH